MDPTIEFRRCCNKFEQLLWALRDHADSLLSRLANLHEDQQRYSPQRLVPRQIEAVCASFGIAIDQMLNRGRQQHIVQARQIAAYLLHVELGLSSLLSGRYLNRDHATVLSSCKLVAARIAAKPEFAKLVKSLSINSPGGISNETANGISDGIAADGIGERRAFTDAIAAPRSMGERRESAPMCNPSPNGDRSPLRQGEGSS